MHRTPILYLDLDDTIISWEGGRPHAAPCANEFLTWALSHFEIRWLTTWCPSGTMEPRLLKDLSSMVGIPTSILAAIHGCAWEGTDSKLNGIAWIDHLLLDRPFFWLEDEYGFKQRERDFLEQHDLSDVHVSCNVTEDRHALARAMAKLRVRYADLSLAAA